MSTPPQRIIIVEHTPDLGKLFVTALTDDGYEATWLLQSLETLEQIRQQLPDLVIADLPFERQDEMRLLDQLRIDRQTDHIPVLAVATNQTQAEMAMTSYNVRERLIKPFDLDRLLEMVARTLDEPPLHKYSPPEEVAGGVIAQAERILAHHSREALLRWVEVLRQQPEWREREDTELMTVLDSAPAIVEALDTALHFGSAAEYFRRQPYGLQRIREHSRIRKQQRMSLGEVVREFSMLRNELWALLGRYLGPEIQTQEMLRLQRAIDGGLDQIIEVLVPAYLEG